MAFASIVAARPDREDPRCTSSAGRDSYSWRIVPLDAVVTEAPSDRSGRLDVLFRSWPEDPSRTRAFFDDLLAELESMADRTDRCRWPLDDPWPHTH